MFNVSKLFECDLSFKYPGGRNSKGQTREDLLNPLLACAIAAMNEPDTPAVDASMRRVERAQTKANTLHTDYKKLEDRYAKYKAACLAALAARQTSGAKLKDLKLLARVCPSLDSKDLATNLSSARELHNTNSAEVRRLRKCLKRAEQALAKCKERIEASFQRRQPTYSGCALPVSGVLVSGGGAAGDIDMRAESAGDMC